MPLPVKPQQTPQPRLAGLDNRIPRHCHDPLIRVLFLSALQHQDETIPKPPPIMGSDDPWNAP
jgi:hypothetical protein